MFTNDSLSLVTKFVKKMYFLLKSLVSEKNIIICGLFFISINDAVFMCNEPTYFVVVGFVAY